MEYTYLTDPKCPGGTLSGAVDLNEYRGLGIELDGDSLATFDAAERNVEEPGTVVFDVDVSGILVWRSSERPSGAFIIEKVWSFRRVDAPERAARPTTN
jgi:hypothetical protein